MDLDSDEREALLEVFFAESAEGLDSMEEALLTLEEHPEDEGALRTLFRAAHTLKGNAASLGFNELAEITHGVEDVLAVMRERRLEADRQVTNLLLASIDALRNLLREPR